VLIVPPFPRNARKFGDHLSSLFTRTITPDEPLVTSVIPGTDQAFIRFRGEYAKLRNGSLIRILQTIGPNPEYKDKVTTLEYSYAFIIGSDPTAEPLVRYEYVPMKVNDPTYHYAIGHVHIDAPAPNYDAYIKPYEAKPLRSVHFPTGRIAIEDFIELLIVEFHVPVPNGDEQAAIRLLRESRDTFRNQKQTRR